MSRFFKNTLASMRRHPILEASAMTGAVMLLVGAAVFVSGGGMSRVNDVLAAYGITPQSQTGCVFPCNNTAYSLQALIPMQGGVPVSSVLPSTAVSWIWNAGAYGANNFNPACLGRTYGNYRDCWVTQGSPRTNFTCSAEYYTGGECTAYACSYDKFGNCVPDYNTCTAYAPMVWHPSSGCGNADGNLGGTCYGASGGYPGYNNYCPGYQGNTANTLMLTAPATPGTYTYYLCSAFLIWYAPAGSNQGCLATNLVVRTPAPTCTLTPATQSVTLPTAPSITYSTTYTTSVSYTVDGVARGAPAGNPFTPIGATTVGSHSVIMSVSGAGGSATCGSSGNVVVNAQGATSCTLSPSSQSITNMQSANFTYTNPNANTTTYSVDGGAPVTVTGGSFSVPPGLSPGTHTVQLAVTNTTNSSTCGAANNLTVTAAPLPSVSVTAGGASSVTINPNATTDLVWSTSGATPGAASITAPSGSTAVTNLGSITGGNTTYYFSAYIVAGGYIYEMGGHNGSAWVNTYRRMAVGSDPTTAAWTSLGTLGSSVNPSISEPVVIGSNAYLFGGYNPTLGYNHNICTAPVASMGTPASWSCPATLPTASNSAKTFSHPVIIGDYVYRFGGYNNAVGGLASVARAPLSSPTSWTNYPNVLSAAIYGQAVAVVGNYVYLLGGYSSTAGAPVNTIYRALITSDLTSPSSWSSGGVTAVANYLHGVAIDANNIYLIGGYLTGGTPTAAIYKLPLGTLSAGSVAAGSWTSAGTLPRAMYPIIPFVDGDKLYMGGGYSTSGYVNPFYKALFNNGLPYTSSANSPWYTDGGNNSAITWPLTIPSVAYTLSATNLTGQSTAVATVNKPDLCTNAPFVGIQNPLPSGVSAAGITCSCIAAGTLWDGSSCSASLPTISSFFGPLRVRSGNTATLSYTVISPTATCSITANNGFAATISPVDGVPGTQQTNEITTNTVFTLTCGGSSRSVSVGITPVYQEQ